MARHRTAYVLPNGRVSGTDANSIVLQTERVVASSAYAEHGTLDGWRANIARYAVGNDLLVLTISTAFGAPLLAVLAAPSGGFHAYGISQSGKTTTVRCAKSVYGPADDKHMRTWRATANGLEAVAAETNDGLLVLDEIAQANAREVDQVVYMLANNAGKARANRVGGARRSPNWSLLFLSTGEMPLEAKLAEASQRVRAGQDVRMIGLSADAGARMGVFQNLHDFPSPAAFAEHLRAATSTDCGTAGPAFLDQLARNRTDDPAMLVATLRGLQQRFLDAHVPAAADGQVRSVASRFALIAAAGELATAYDITGWPKSEALRAAGACFRRWLAARGGIGAAEDMQAVEQVRAFIAAHGASRFETLIAVVGADGEMVAEERIVANRAGWKPKKDGEWQYLITPDCWKTEVCRGLNPKLAAEALDRAGFLLPGKDGRLTDAPRTGSHTTRVYIVHGSILGSGHDGE